MAENLPWIVAIAGLLLMFVLVRNRRLDWTGRPILIVVAIGTLSAGISPVVEKMIGKSFTGGFERMGIPGFYDHELPSAIGLLLLSYSALLLGMFGTRIIGRIRTGNFQRSTLQKIQRKPLLSRASIDRGWRASLGLFGFGVLFNLFLMYRLAFEVPIGEWAATRAVFTSALSENVLFGYAHLLSTSMQVGAWGLLVFSTTSRNRLWLALAANGLYFATEILFGGRLHLIAGFYVAVMIYHYWVQSLKWRELFALTVIGFIGIAALSALRFDFASSHQTWQSLADTLLIPRSISEAVWALRYWPARIPFFDGITTLHGWQFIFPNLQFVEMGSTSEKLVDLFFGGQDPYRFGGGIHLGYAVEQYIDLGFVGVIGLGLLYGIVIGLPYEWQARQPKNPLLLLLVGATTITLLSGLEGKMAQAVGHFFFSYLLPIGILASLTVGGEMRRRIGVKLWAVLYCGFIFYILNHLTGWEFFDYLFALLLGVAYIYSLLLIQSSMEIGSSLMNSPDHIKSHREQVALP